MVTWPVCQWKAERGAHSLVTQWSNWSLSCRQWRLQTSVASVRAEVWSRITHDHFTDRQRRSWESRSPSSVRAMQSCAYLTVLRPTWQGCKAINGWSVYFSQVLRHTCCQSNSRARSLVKLAQVTFTVRSLYVCCRHVSLKFDGQ